MAVAAVVIAVQAIGALWRGPVLHRLDLGVLLLTAFGAINWLLGLYLLRVGRRTRSPALVADARQLLGVVPAGPNADVAPRMLVIRRESERWALEVDEVLDFRHIDASAVKDPQVTVSKAAVHFTAGMIDLGDGFGALLDAERLFAGLARSLT